MTEFWNHQHLRGALRRLGTHAAVQAAVVGLVVAGIAAPASADSNPSSQVVTTVQVRPATARLGDEQHDFLIFVNKSRADLCTPERYAFEQEFQAWLDGGQQGDPPPEPASSQQGVKDVQFIQRITPSATTFSIDGPDLPVEVWKLEDNPDGIDCSATDGPGAELFATGTMTWRSVRVMTTVNSRGTLSVEGRIVGTDGQAYNYLVRYGSGPVVSQLVPTS